QEGPAVRRERHPPHSGHRGRTERVLGHAAELPLTILPEGKMKQQQFETILGHKKAARLRNLVRAVAGGPFGPSEELYQVIYGDCNDNEFTNEAVEVLCCLAVDFYHTPDGDEAEAIGVGDGRLSFVLFNGTRYPAEVFEKAQQQLRERGLPGTTLQT